MNLLCIDDELPELTLTEHDPEEKGILYPVFFLDEIGYDAMYFPVSTKNQVFHPKLSEVLPSNPQNLTENILSYTIKISKEYYSFLIIDVLSEEEYALLLNGKLITVTNTNGTLIDYVRSYIPIDFVNNGKNKIEFQFKSIPKTAVDVKAKLSTTDCILVNVGGTAVDIPHTTVWNKEPEYAFDNDDTTQWGNSEYPVYLEYTFGRNNRALVNRIAFDRFYSYKGFVTKLHVEGVNNGRATLLFSAEGEALNKRGKATTFTFDNDEFYSSYRIYFDAAAKNESLVLSLLQLYSCSTPLCKKVGFPSSTTFTSMKKNCPIGKVGSRVWTCLTTDKSAQWVKDDEACLTRMATKKVSYVDWKIQIMNLHKLGWPKIEEKVLAFLVKYTYVPSEDINFYFFDDCSTLDTLCTKISIRISAVRMIGDYIQYHLTELASSFSELFKNEVDDTYECTIVDEVVLRQIPSFTVFVMACVIVILSIIALILYLLYVKSKGKKVKTLSHNEEVYQPMV
jgi:hypothetical protein